MRLLKSKNETKIDIHFLDGGQWPMEVTEIRIGNALFNRNLGKSIFFVGEPVQVCMTGKFRQGFSAPLSNLQNSVHGTVLGGIINREFCDIDTVGCNGFQSGVSCNAGPVSANDNFCYCTYITEVEASPIDVSTTIFNAFFTRFPRFFRWMLT